MITATTKVTPAPLPMNAIFKVSSVSKPTLLGGAIAKSLRDREIATLQAIGAGAINQMMKAVTVARHYLTTTDGTDLICAPEFIDLIIEERECTALRLHVSLPGRSLPLPARSLKAEEDV